MGGIDHGRLCDFEKHNFAMDNLGIVVDVRYMFDHSSMLDMGGSLPDLHDISL